MWGWALCSHSSLTEQFFCQVIRGERARASLGSVILGTPEWPGCRGISLSDAVSGKLLVNLCEWRGGDEGRLHKSSCVIMRDEASITTENALALHRECCGIKPSRIHPGFNLPPYWLSLTPGWSTLKDHFDSPTSKWFLVESLAIILYQEHWLSLFACCPTGFCLKTISAIVRKMMWCLVEIKEQMYQRQQQGTTCLSG